MSPWIRKHRCLLFPELLESQVSHLHLGAQVILANLPNLAGRIGLVGLVNLVNLVDLPFLVALAGQVVRVGLVDLEAQAFLF